MIYFVKNKHLENGLIKKDAKFIESFDINEISTTLITTQVVFKDSLKNFRITNKGGRRFIDYIKKIDSNYSNAIIIYDEVLLNYIIETDPYKLYSPTELSAAELINKLLNPEVTRFEYESWKLLPKSFINSEAIRNWILTQDPSLGVALINEIRSYKEQHPEFLMRDIKEFSNDFPSIHSISKKYGFEESTVANGFLTLFL